MLSQCDHFLLLSAECCSYTQADIDMKETQALFRIIKCIFLWIFVSLNVCLNSFLPIKSYPQASESKAALFISNRVLTVHATLSLPHCLHSDTLLRVASHWLHCSIAAETRRNAQIEYLHHNWQGIFCKMFNMYTDLFWSNSSKMTVKTFIMLQKLIFQIRVGPIDDAIVQRRWLIDITMLSRILRFLMDWAEFLSEIWCTVM